MHVRTCIYARLLLARSFSAWLFLPTKVFIYFFYVTLGQVNYAVVGEQNYNFNFSNLACMISPETFNSHAFGD